MKIPRKLLGPSALILLASLSYGIAQQYTRSIQQSQDLTGSILVDSNLGVYFPAHILSTGTGRPAPTVAGTGSTPTISTGSTDFAGTVTAGTSTTQINITFGQAYLSAPNCVVSWQSTSATTSPLTYTLVTTGININQGATTGNKLNYFCTAPS